MTTVQQQSTATEAPGRAVMYLWNAGRGVFERVPVGVWISGPCYQCGTWDLWWQLTGDTPPTGDYLCRLCDPVQLGGTVDEVTR